MQQEGVVVNDEIADPINDIRILQQWGGGGGGGGGQAGLQEQQQQQQHQLRIRNAWDVDRQSVQYLVDFLQGDTHQVIELELSNFNILQPSDGGFHALRDLFANNTTLTKVKLDDLNVGSAEEASQLIDAFQTNRSVTDLNIETITELHGTALGHCISGLLQNNATLQQLRLRQLNPEVISSFQPGLQTNRHLKILDLAWCRFGDEGLHLIVDALVGNTTIEVLDIRVNNITSNGVDDITRLVEFTQLKIIRMNEDDDLFADVDAMKKLISVLHRHVSLEELTVIDSVDYYLDYYPKHRDAVVAINIISARNRILKRANALLALQPRTGLPIGSKSGIWYKAMAKMARSHQVDWGDDDPTYLGVSAIFKIFQARPAILEYQLPRPSAAASALQLHEREDRRVKRRRIL